PLRNACEWSLSDSADPRLRNPTTGIAGWCARAASGHAAPPPTSVMNCFSLDHLVRAGEERRGDLWPASSRAHKTDGGVTLGCQDDLSGGRVGAFEVVTCIDADLTPHGRRIGPIAHQAAGFDLLASGMGRRKPVAGCKRRKLAAPADEERVGRDD